MTILLLPGLSMLLQLSAAIMAIKLNWICGRRWVWNWLAGTMLLLLAGTDIHFSRLIATHTRLNLCVELVTFGVSLMMLIGITMIGDVFQAMKCQEKYLNREKRHLSMMVDRRVGDLETEVTERKRAEEKLRHDGERLSALIATQQEIATAELDLRTVMDLIVTKTQELTQASGAVIQLIEGHEMVYRAVSGRAAPYAGLRTCAEKGLSGECVRSGEVLRCNDAERDARVDLEACRRVGARSMVVAPLYYDRAVVGVLEVVSPERYAFSAGDVHTLQLMTGLVGTAMSHRAEFEAKQRLLSEAIERADRDPLTSLLNHRAFHRRLEEEADRAQREGTCMAVAVIDMDNFKFFNDVYGHTVGDDVLRQVAGALASCCRSYDTLARYGGDEFAILMPGVDTERATQMVERINSSLDGVGYRPPDYDTVIPLTLSVGMAVFPQERPTRLDTLELADARLRHAKYGNDPRAEQLRADLASSVTGFTMLDALVTAVDTKDRYTQQHCEDVLTYGLEIARELEMDAQTQRVVAVAALLHDVGKIGVPDYILRKPGRLTDAEYEAIKQHPQMGAMIVGAVPGFEEILDAVRFHHERWDGGGYPMGLRGLEIPLLARLMAVADAYSAMTTDRPYRKGMAAAQALDILEKGAGTQWDADCVEAFLRTRGKRKTEVSRPHALAA